MSCGSETNPSDLDHSFHFLIHSVHDDVQLCQWLRTKQGTLKLGDFNRAEIMDYNIEKNEYCRYNNGKAYGNVSPGVNPNVDSGLSIPPSLYPSPFGSLIHSTVHRRSLLNRTWTKRLISFRSAIIYMRCSLGCGTFTTMTTTMKSRNLSSTESELLWIHVGKREATSNPNWWM